MIHQNEPIIDEYTQRYVHIQVRTHTGNLEEHPVKATEKVGSHFLSSHFALFLETITNGIPNSMEEWFVANVFQSGFFRIQYDNDTLFQLVDQLDVNASVSGRASSKI